VPLVTFNRTKIETD